MQIPNLPKIWGTLLPSHSCSPLSWIIPFYWHLLMYLNPVGWMATSVDFKASLNREWSQQADLSPVGWVATSVDFKASLIWQQSQQADLSLSLIYITLSSFYCWNRHFWADSEVSYQMPQNTALFAVHPEVVRHINRLWNGLLDLNKRGIR